jgi:sec-independent protein translocase protein TatA
MLGDISVTKLLIILVIIIALFGTKKLRSIGKDLGGAVKGFKDAMNEGETEENQKQLAQQQQKQHAENSQQVKHEDKG